ncbi:MAG: hypothetical protein FWC43_13300 [Planctomycetaceae bacterium]|nr:hypothetical protein [Planctomycetaceae bacterium]
MRKIVLFSLVFLLFPVLIGCPGKTSHRRSSGGLAEDQTRQNDEAFQNVLELFNTMEETPTLRGLPGMSIEQQRVAQLNRWIAHRSEDKLWKSDPFYEELKAAFGDVSVKIGSILESVQKLQSEDEKEAASVDVKQMIVTLAGLPDDLTRLNKQSSINFRAEIAMFQSLADRFQTARNEQEAAILARAEQVKAELERVVMFHSHFSDIDDLLDVRDLNFRSADVDHFKQVVWARNIATWAKGNKQGDIDRAVSLFDWTVRNVDLRPEIAIINGQPVAAPIQEPWLTLLSGQGLTHDRAWIFVELLRQLRIDACLLAYEKEDAPGQYESWAVGVLSNNEIYLFSPAYGVAIPGPQGLRLSEQTKQANESEGGAETGEIAYNDVATLAQVVENDQLLRKLDTDLTPFPVNAEQAKKSVAFLFTSPCMAAQRMSLVQKELSGEEAMVLYQAYQDQADRFSKVANIVEVRHSYRPLRAAYEREIFPQWGETLLGAFYVEEPETKHYSLWIGRILYFKGKLVGPESAMTFFQEARVSDRKLEELTRNPEMYMTQEKFAVYMIAKRFARYWIGLTCLENGNTVSAKEHFLDEEKDPIALSGQLWSHAIAYNLGRAFERLGQYADAISRYEKNPRAPTGPGNAVRVKWLKELTQE